MTTAATKTAPAAARLAAWIVGFASLLLLTLLCLSRRPPPLPPVVTLQLTFPAGIAGRMEPLVSAGVFAEADFLVVKYLDEKTAVFIYDFWGVGGTSSATVTFEPGSRHTLRLEMPALAEIRGASTKLRAALRLQFDGRDILQTEVPFHRRESAQIYFGENPIGGTTGGGVFRGEIRGGDGRIIRGGPGSFFTWPNRFGTWLVATPWQILAIVLASLAAGFAARRLIVWGAAHPLRLPPTPVVTGNAAPPHRWFVGVAALCTLAFAYVITGGTFRIIFSEAFGSFYDYQAVSLLHGQLDVPEPALSGESFVFAGKYYGYFGPTPALLRLPFAIFDVGFAKLSRSFMIVDYVACLGAVYALLVCAARLLSGRRTWPSRTDVVLLVGGAGLGSTLFFLSSRAYIYHEAILCGAAFSLWGSYCTLRYLAGPERRWWLGALACGTLAVHARPPIGLFALSFLGCAAAAHVIRAMTPASRPTLFRHLSIGTLSVAGVLSFNGLSYLKFKTFDGAPLKYHVQYNPGRLAVIEGKNFHAGNFRYNFDGYIWRPNFLFRPTFPYFYAEGRNPNDYPGAKIDLAEPTLALPYAMPAIVFLAVVGGACAVVRWPGVRRTMLVLAAAVVPMAAALFTAIAISHRYTADFFPFLLIAAAFGLVSLELLPRGWQHTLRALTAMLLLCSILITIALTLHYQGEGVWGVPDDVTQRFLTIRKEVDSFFGLPHK